MVFNFHCVVVGFIDFSVLLLVSCLPLDLVAYLSIQPSFHCDRFAFILFVLVHSLDFLVFS